MTRILVTGKAGQVGTELAGALAPLGEVVALDRIELDLTDAQAIRATVREVKPHVIVNAAAHTAVDRAEAEPELALAVNGIAPGILAEEARACGAWLVHYSTDYVFDGGKVGPYTEDDLPNPLGVYGKTKLAGERAIQATGGSHLILRTSWVYGARGRNFYLTIRRLAAERDELKIVSDQVGAPTWCRDIARATASMLERIRKTPSQEANALSGTYNLTAEGSCSWHGFASAIVEEATPAGRKPRVVSIPTSEYPTPAARPLNSVLTHEKLKQTFGITLPNWRDSLRACVAAS